MDLAKLKQQYHELARMIEKTWRGCLFFHAYWSSPLWDPEDDHEFEYQPLASPADGIKAYTELDEPRLVLALQALHALGELIEDFGV